MGYYTEFMFSAALKHDLPQDVNCVLSYLLGEIPDEEAPPCPPEFKNCERWYKIMRASQGSFHTYRNLNRECHYPILDFRSEIKNYDQEIQAFLTWIIPHLADDNNFLGYYRGEDSDMPTLIYVRQVDGVPAIVTVYGPSLDIAPSQKQ